jgi:hypothetical protein
MKIDLSYRHYNYIVYIRRKYMSLPSWILPFKELRSTINCIKGIYYKYAVTYHYDPDRKRTLPKSGLLLGKITEQDGFVPSS